MDVRDNIIESYKNLLYNYTTEHSSAFLRACWLIPDNAVLANQQFKKMIFTIGSSDEIYTQDEIIFINSIKSYIDYYTMTKSINGNNINCKIVSVNFSNYIDTLFSSIEFMKIFDKAFNGFNFYLFVFKDKIHIGCSYLNSTNINNNCLITPAIPLDFNWDLFAEYLIYRDDSDEFYEYYNGIVEMITDITNNFKKDFLNDEEKENDLIALNNYYLDDISVSEIAEIIAAENAYSSVNIEDDDKLSFQEQKIRCFQELEFIRSSSANSLELLYEADEQLKKFSSKTDDSLYQQDDEDSFDVAIQDELEMLNDPIALMKKLKLDKGIK